MRNVSKWLGFGLWLAASPLWAADNAVEVIRKALTPVLPAGATIDSIRPSPVQGLYEVVYGAEVMYVTANGRYALSGELADVEKRTNLTEQVRSQGRLRVINQLRDEELVVFAPKKTDYTVTVFTDIDCGYCRKMHGEMSQYLAKGIKVRYAFFPRTGLNTESHKKANAVWCAKDRADAMNRAMLGKPVESVACASQVAKQYNVGRAIGLDGTPTIVMENGKTIPGYVPAARLRQELDGKS